MKNIAGIPENGKKENIEDFCDLINDLHHEKITLKKATTKDKATVIEINYNLNKVQHVEQKRAKKITKAISAKQCFIILANTKAVGFVLFDYRFFDQGWIELMIIAEKYRRQGIVQTLDLISKQAKTNKVFTSTNQSNGPMQKALSKAGFTFAGELIGLDDGDPELFYYKKMEK